MNEKELLYIIGKMEKKLRHYMGDEEFFKFSTRIAREAFKQGIDEMANGPFKDFLQENYKQITGEAAECGPDYCDINFGGGTKA